MITPIHSQHSRVGVASQPPTKDAFGERPLLVFWEMPRAYALAYSHCRAEAQYRRDPNELSLREAEHVVDQLAELNPPMLVLTGGDPMERPDVLDIAARASAADLQVGPASVHHSAFATSAASCSFLTPALSAREDSCHSTAAMFVTAGSRARAYGFSMPLVRMPPSPPAGSRARAYGFPPPSRFLTYASSRRLAGSRLRLHR